MKMKSLLQLLAFLITGQFLFSCSSAEYYKFSAQKPEAYNKIKEKPAPVTEPAEEAISMAEIALAAAQEESQKQAEPLLEASAEANTPVISKNKTAEIVKIPALTETVSPEKGALSIAEAEALAMAKERLADMTKAEKKELKKELREAYRQRASGTSIIEIILAFLLPPLAVFLHDGIGTSFWINIILTLLFVIPGIIHALLVVTDTI